METTEADLVTNTRATRMTDHTLDDTTRTRAVSRRPLGWISARDQNSMGPTQSPIAKGPRPEELLETENGRFRPADIDATAAGSLR
jgi:hypothetical protein